MTTDQKPKEEAGLIPTKSKGSAQGSIQNIGDLDFQDLFQFETREVTLGEREVWTLKGQFMPFGKGARRLAIAMGVEFLMPEKIMIDGKPQSNPYIVFKEGKAVGIYILKHGISIAPDGIRYLQPNLDYIDIDSVVAAMAMNTQKYLMGESQDAAKNCTRTVFEAMKKGWKKPGDPDWFFIPTLDNETGIAFNMGERGKAGDKIRKLQSDIVGLRRYPLRKIQTATDRLVFEKLHPEALTAHVEGSEDVRKVGFSDVVRKIKWNVTVPTARPIARALITELGIALRDNDAQARREKFSEIVKMLGGATVPMQELSPVRLGADEVSEGYEDEARSIPTIKPCPAKMNMKQFKAYFNSEFRKMTDDQKELVLKASSFETWDGFSLKKADMDPITEVFMDIGGIASPETKSADDARKHMLEWYAESDGKGGILDELLKEHDFNAETDFNLIPDEVIADIYSKFTDHLKDQEKSDEASKNKD